MSSVLSGPGRVIAPAILILSIAAPGVSSEPILTGFTAEHSEQERVLERTLMSLPDPTLANVEHAKLTAEPHIAGSEADHRTAEYVLEQLRSYGLDAEVESVDVTLSEPRELSIELLEPGKWVGPSRENVESDPVSSNPKNPIGFNAYSATGDVQSSVVYANYGLPVDYVMLRDNGIKVEGKIVIARYGMCYRGVKARVAEENKAAALILYSDPDDDGYHAGDVYPVGPWRPPSGVERGSVLYDFIYPGTTTDHQNQPRIPVMPLSYSDAEHILAAMNGPAAPKQWQGGLPFTYHLGPGAAKVLMHVRMEENVRPVWNVVARIPGTESPKELVIAGNHRDAWAYGGVDPNSGTVALLEVGRSLGALLRSGWHPRRSILLCSWDAEEQDELGSTQWASRHEQELRDGAAAYLNLDAATSGKVFTASSTLSLKRFMREIAMDVPDPQGGSILDQAQAHYHRERNKISETETPVPVGIKEVSENFPVDDLGGGTDYVAFYNHLGIPATDFAFRGDYGQYHSIFDNHEWMTRFGDPKFLYHIAAARYYGVEILRLAEADILPLNYVDYADAISSILVTLSTRDGATMRLEWNSALLSTARMRKAALGAQRQIQSCLDRYRPSASFALVNHMLVQVEQSFLDPSGLPGRPWYRQLMFAPGMDNGYSAESMPGVRESFDRNDLQSAEVQLRNVINAIDQAVILLDRIRCGQGRSEQACNPGDIR
jgi:N-acetylated-alpha-linked acidic dipeptidase